ncbi:lipoyl synthase [Candidatus Omnitrophota bacterium]
MNRLPEWFTKKIPQGKQIKTQLEHFKRLQLHTVCESAHCPNIVDCFNSKRATFMILGTVCSRACRFCAVNKGIPQDVDSLEPIHIAEAVRDMHLSHVVVTSVTRDDLPDGGAHQFAKTIEQIRACNPQVVIEVLIPDFKGDLENIQMVVSAKPDIIGHNLETVPRLYSDVRPQADYCRSLRILKSVKDLNHSMYTKSGILLGFGESFEEVVQSMKDLRDVECDIITLGQYLAPSKQHKQVERYVSPGEFQEFKEIGISLGFKSVASGPWVRSSYYAKELFQECMM